MRIEDALEHLETIHEQVLRSETFRGYRAASVGGTGVLAVVAGVFQNYVLAPKSVAEFIGYWITIAAIACCVIGFDLAVQIVRQGRSERRRTWYALRHLLPALFVGAALTATLVDTVVADRLPAIWALCFGLGIVASRPFLAAGLGYVGSFYLAVGAALLLPPFHATLPSPIVMGLVFGGGQLFAAMLFRRGEANGLHAKSKGKDQGGWIRGSL